MEIIDIASFDFDDEKIRKKIDELNDLIFDNQKKIKESKQVLSDLSKEYEKSSKELSKQGILLKNTEKNYKNLAETIIELEEGQLKDKYVQENKKRLENIKSLQKEQEKLQSITNERLRSISSEETSISNLTKEISVNRREVSNLTKLIDDQSKALEILNKGYENEEKSIKGIRDLRSSLIEVRNREISQDGEQTEKGKALNNVISELTELEKNLVSETEKRFYQIGDYAGQLEGNFNHLSQVIQQINNNEAVKTSDVKKAKEQLVKVREQEVESIKKSNKGTEEEIAILISENEKIKELDKTLELLNQREKFGNLRAELKDLISTLAGLKAEGKSNSKEYEELKNRATELKAAISTVNSEVTKSSSSTKVLDGLVNTTTTLTSVFSIAQGVTALFGEENEDLQKTILQVTSVISILNGLQQIQTEFKKKDNAITIIQTGLQKTYATIVGKSTGALKVFNIALKSTGIGLVILLLGSLIANWDKVTASIKGSFPSLDGFGERLDKVKAYVMGFLNSYLSLYKTVFNSIKKLVSLDFKGALNEISNIGENAKKAYQNGKKESLEATAREKANKELKKKIEQDQRDIEVLEARNGKKEYKLRAKNIEEQLSLVKKGSDEEIKLKQDLRLLNAEELRKQSEDEEKKNKKDKSNAEKRKKEQEKNTQELLNLRAKYSKELRQLTLSYTQEELANQIKNSEKILKNEKLLTEDLLKEEIDRQKSIEKAKEQKITNQYNSDKSEIGNDYEKELKDVEKLKVSLTEKNKLKEDLKKISDLKLLSLDKKYEQDLLENKEVSQTKQEELEKSYNALRVKNLAFNLQQEIETLQNNNANQYDIKKAQLDKENILEREKLEELYRDKTIQKEQYDTAVKNLEDKKRKDLETLEIEKEADDNQRFYDDKINRMIAQGEWEYDILLTQLAKETQAKEDQARKDFASGKINAQELANALEAIDADSAEKRKNIERDKMRAQVAIIGEGLDGISDLLGKETTASKGIMAAKALMNSWLAVTEIWSNKTTIPEPFGTIQKVGATATALASALNAVKQIKSVNVKSGTGGSSNTTSIVNNYKAGYAGGELKLQGNKNSNISSYNESNVFSSNKMVEQLKEAVEEGSNKGSKNGSLQGSRNGIFQLSKNNNVNAVAKK